MKMDAFKAIKILRDCKPKEGYGDMCWQLSDYHHALDDLEDLITKGKVSDPSSCSRAWKIKIPIESKETNCKEAIK